MASFVQHSDLYQPKIVAGKNWCPCEKDRKQIYVWLCMFCRWRFA